MIRNHAWWTAILVAIIPAVVMAGPPDGRGRHKGPLKKLGSGLRRILGISRTDRPGWGGGADDGRFPAEDPGWYRSEEVIEVPPRLSGSQRIAGSPWFRSAGGSLFAIYQAPSGRRYYAMISPERGMGRVYYFDPAIQQYHGVYDYATKQYHAYDAAAGRWDDPAPPPVSPPPPPPRSAIARADRPELNPNPAGQPDGGFHTGRSRVPPPDPVPLEPAGGRDRTNHDLARAAEPGRTPPPEPVPFDSKDLHRGPGHEAGPTPPPPPVPAELANRDRANDPDQAHTPPPDPLPAEPATRDRDRDHDQAHTRPPEPVPGNPSRHDADPDDEGPSLGPR